MRQHRQLQVLLTIGGRLVSADGLQKTVAMLSGLQRLHRRPLQTIGFTKLFKRDIQLG
jgi:hypothetical protein